MVQANGTQISAATPTTSVAVLEKVTPILVVLPISSGIPSHTSGCPVGQRWSRVRVSSVALPETPSPPVPPAPADPVAQQPIAQVPWGQRSKALPRSARSEERRG